MVRRSASAIQIVRPLESIAETTAIAGRNAPKSDQTAANELIRVLDETRRACCLAVAAPQTHWTKVLFPVVGTGSTIIFDYVIRRLDALWLARNTGWRA